MIVDGDGLLGRAFAREASEQPSAYVFARGVADSTCRDPAPYARERAMLADGLELAASRGLTFVYFSGAPIFGSFDAPVDERTQIRPITDYGVHQAAAERMIEDHRARHLLVRLPNVVGPSGNPHQLLPALLAQVRSGTVDVQDGAERDLIAVEDVVRLVRALLATDIADRTVVVASGISTPVRDIVAWLSSDLSLTPVTRCVSGGTSQRFRTDLLRSLVPGGVAFRPDYARSVVREFARAATTPASA
jgi:hypothetical protein